MSKSAQDSQSPAKPPDPTPEQQAQMDADAAYQDAVAIEVNNRRWDLTGSRRLQVYSDILPSLYAASGFPTGAVGSDMTLAASQQEGLDDDTKRATKRTLLAVLKDIQRLAKASVYREPSCPYGEGE